MARRRDPQEDIGLRGDGRLRGNVSMRLGWGVRIGVSVGRRGLKFGGEGSWYMKECGKTENGYNMDVRQNGVWGIGEWQRNGPVPARQRGEWD